MSANELQRAAGRLADALKEQPYQQGDELQPSIDDAGFRLQGLTGGVAEALEAYSEAVSQPRFEGTLDAIWGEG